MVKVVQNIPTVLLYLPPQLSVSSQVCSRPENTFCGFFCTHSASSFCHAAAEPVSVRCGGLGRGVVGEEEETVCSGGTSGARRWIQTGCRAQTLISKGISEKQCLFTKCYTIQLYSDAVIHHCHSVTIHHHECVQTETNLHDLELHIHDVLSSDYFIFVTPDNHQK